MSSEDSQSLRMVIQQLSVSPPSSYRIVVYGDDQRPRHAEFNNTQILLDTLRAAMLDFDLSRLTFNPLEEGQGSIVFAGEMKLREMQLALLGLGSV